MPDVDTLLREAFERLAEPGDPSGVAAAIRSRVASTPPGGSGGSPSGGGWTLASWAPWVGLAAVLGVAGTAAGLAGVFGHPPAAPEGVLGSLDGGVAALGCPDGAVAEHLRPGERVLAIERTDDGTWLAVRDPYALTETVWLPSGALVSDDGQPAVATLPVGGCPTVSVAPSPTPTPAAPAPKPTTKPTTKPPAKDTAPPAISASAFTPVPIYGKPSSCGDEATITVTASDNVAVSSVTGSADFAGSTITSTGHSGSSYTFSYHATLTGNDGGASAGHTVTVTFTATDSSGNTASVSRTLTLISSYYCLI